MSYCLYPQCGQGVQSVEGSRVHRGDLVVIERQEAHRAQPHEAAVTHTAESVTPQHTAHKNTQTHTGKIDSKHCVFNRK